MNWRRNRTSVLRVKDFSLLLELQGLGFRAGKMDMCVRKMWVNPITQQRLSTSWLSFKFVSGVLAHRQSLLSVVLSSLLSFSISAIEH